MKRKSKYEGKFHIGQQFGKWKVIDTTIIVTKEAMILCKCECGTEKIVSIFTLLKGMSTQCRRCADKLKNIQVIPQSMINEIKKFAEKNKISFELTDQDIMDISIKYVIEKKKIEQSEPMRAYNISSQISGCYGGTITTSASYSTYPIISATPTLTCSEPTLNLVQSSNYAGGGLYSNGQSGYNSTGSFTGSVISNTISTTPTSNYEPYLYRMDQTQGYTKENTIIVNKNDLKTIRNSTSSAGDVIVSSENIKQDIQKFKTNSTLNFLLNRRD